MAQSGGKTGKGGGSGKRSAGRRTSAGKDAKTPQRAGGRTSPAGTAKAAGKAPAKGKPSSSVKAQGAAEAKARSTRTAGAEKRTASPKPAAKAAPPMEQEDGAQRAEESAQGVERKLVAALQAAIEASGRAQSQTSAKKSAGMRYGRVALLCLVSALAGIGFFALFDRTASYVFAERPAQAQITATLQNADMYSGPRPDGLEDAAGGAPLSHDARRAMALADDAVQYCHAGLQRDLEVRRAWGQIDQSAYAAHSLEPHLRDLNFYLPCLMRVNQKRFCNLAQKTNLVQRIKAYLQLLEDAKEARKRGVQVVRRPQAMLHQAKAQNGNGLSEPLPMRFDPDPEIVDALRRLARLGYIGKGDFAAWWWPSVPDAIQTIFEGHSPQEDACAS